MIIHRRQPKNFFKEYGLDSNGPLRGAGSKNKRGHTVIKGSACSTESLEGAFAFGAHSGHSNAGSDYTTKHPVPGESALQLFDKGSIHPRWPRH